MPEWCPVYGSPVFWKNLGFNPRELLQAHAFINKNIEDTPTQMGLHVRVYRKNMFVLYLDCVGNCCIFSFYKTRNMYKIRSTINVSTKEGVNVDKTPGHMLTSINMRGSSEDDAVEAVAKFCAVFEIDRLAHEKEQSSF